MLYLLYYSYIESLLGNLVSLKLPEYISFALKFNFIKFGIKFYILIFRISKSIIDFNFLISNKSNF